MRIREVLPGSTPWLDASSDDGREWLGRQYALERTDYVRLNMITSLTGSATGSDGTSDTLTSKADRIILGIIRREADVVLVGAGTVRAEEYVLPRRAALAVVTSTGDLSGHRIDAEAGDVYLVVPESRVQDVRRRSDLPHAEIVPVEGEDVLDPRAIVSALAERGLRRMVCEGGPVLAAAFARAGSIDEYCVSVAPVLEPARRPFLPLPDDVDLRTDVVGALMDEAGFSYLRLRPRA